MGDIQNCELQKKLSFDDAIELTGFGLYNISMLASCCLLILAMYLDIFGFSVALPAVACDMRLDTTQQGLLSAIPLIGVMIASYGWGLCADTLGRRKTLLIAMPVGAIFNVAASLAPTYPTLAILKFLSACFTSSANAAAFVLLGECAPQRYRGPFMFLMASTTMFAQLIICVTAIPTFQATFRIHIPWLYLTYRPWRLLLQAISVPGIIGCIGMMFLDESPKYLLSKGLEEDALKVLAVMHYCNKRSAGSKFNVASLYLDEDDVKTSSDATFAKKVCNQTAPLFKPPLLKNSLKLYYILLCAYMTSTGYTMWVPTMTNAYFDGKDTSSKTFCEVASRAARHNTNDIIKQDFELSPDCDTVIQPMTLYAVMCYSGASGILTILLSFLVKPLGKRRTTLLVFFISAICGVLLPFIKIPFLSIICFYTFLYVALILGNVNTYLVELNPTYLRGMATCLSVVVARGFGFFSVQIIASLLTHHCTPMVVGYVALVLSGMIVAYFLPSDNPESRNNSQKNTSRPEE